jgi:hypothetical protein
MSIPGEVSGVWRMLHDSVRWYVVSDTSSIRGLGIAIEDTGPPATGGEGRRPSRTFVYGLSTLAARLHARQAFQLTLYTNKYPVHGLYSSPGPGALYGFSVHA